MAQATELKKTTLDDIDTVTLGWWCLATELDGTTNDQKLVQRSKPRVRRIGHAGSLLRSS